MSLNITEFELRKAQWAFENFVPYIKEKNIEIKFASIIQGKNEDKEVYDTIIRRSSDSNYTTINLFRAEFKIKDIIVIISIWETSLDMDINTDKWYSLEYNESNWRDKFVEILYTMQLEKDPVKKLFETFKFN
jgi:hypothetical protein